MAESGFPGITGYEDVIRQLKHAGRTGSVSHAYLFTGPEGCGKRKMAEAFAAMLVCEAEDPGERPCMNCSGCKRAFSGNHPDIIRVTHEKPLSISVNEIRAQLVDKAVIRPYEDKKKVFIVAEAEKMTPQAQNALLKTLEEPPEYAVILLLSTNPETLLPTIRSRTLMIPLNPLPNRVVEEYIREKMEMPDYEARVIAAYAQGIIGRAEKAVRDEAFSERRDRALALVKGIHSMNAATIREAARRMGEDRKEAEEILDLCLFIYRDILYYKAAADPGHLVFSNEIGMIRERAAAISYKALTEIIEALEQCQGRLKANVNPELAAELLLYRIRDCEREN